MVRNCLVIKEKSTEKGNLKIRQVVSCEDIIKIEREFIRTIGVTVKK